MRKIDKTTQFSTVYKTWENDLENRKQAHPKYNSSNGEHYYSIVMDLLRCQNGLCAYTEVRLCKPDFYAKEHWTNDVYDNSKWTNGVPYKGQLEHFDESLKSKKAGENDKKDWLWVNFFIIESDTNIKKGVKKVADFLKPDRSDYSPEKYLEYNQNTHCFEAKESLDDIRKNKIKDSLEVLGINHPTVVHRRKVTLNAYFRYGVPNDEFPTAIAFCKSK